MSSSDTCIVEVGLSCINMTFNGTDRRFQVSHLRTIYDFLRQKSMRQLQLKGLNCLPNSQREGQQAVLCLPKRFQYAFAYYIQTVALTNILDKFCIVILSLYFTKTPSSQPSSSHRITPQNNPSSIRIIRRRAQQNI
jgi:hypothetical protein